MLSDTEKWRQIIDAIMTSDYTRGWCDWWEEKKQLEIYFDYIDSPEGDRLVTYDCPVTYEWHKKTRFEEVAGDVWIWLDKDGWHMYSRYTLGGEVTETNELHFQTLTRALCTIPDAYPIPDYVWSAICYATRGL